MSLLIDAIGSTISAFFSKITLPLSESITYATDDRKSSGSSVPCRPSFCPFDGRAAGCSAAEADGFVDGPGALAADEAAAAALPAAAAANVFFLLSILGPPRLTSFRLGLATKPLVDPAFFDAGCGAFFFVLS